MFYIIQSFSDHPAHTHTHTHTHICTHRGNSQREFRRHAKFPQSVRRINKTNWIPARRYVDRNYRVMPPEGDEGGEGLINFPANIARLPGWYRSRSLQKIVAAIFSILASRRKFEIKRRRYYPFECRREFHEMNSSDIIC